MSKRIVFLHGFTQRGAIWNAVLSLISSRLGDEWELIAPDLPGHGESLIADDETFWMTAATLAETYGPAHWVGYSLGGRTLLHLAIAHPDAMESMTVVGAKAGFADRAEAANRIHADENIAKRLDAMSGVDDLREWLENTWLAMPMFAGLDDVGRQVDLRVANVPKNLAASLRRHGSGVQEYLVPLLQNVQTPTTVLWAQHDNALIMGDCKVLTNAIPHAIGVEVPGVGHSIPWEASDAFADLVVQRVMAT